MLRLSKPIWILVLLLCSACSARSSVPTGTPVPSETALPAGTRAAASPTLVSALSTSDSSTLPTAAPSSLPTQPPTLAPTASPTASALPAGFSPVLLGKRYDADTFFNLLGGVEGGRWLSADEAAARIAGASPYDVYTLAGGRHSIYGYAPGRMPISPEYFLETDAALHEAGMLGVAPGWPVQQRPVASLSVDNELYRQIVNDWLAAAGVVDPQPGTLQIYRTDLEGDGMDEVFISATRVESAHGTQPGDHSIVLMRKVSGGETVTVPVLVDLYTQVGEGNPFPCTYTLGNFLDLNQDGVLEVLVEFDRWEGFGAAVYQVQDQNVTQVLGHTCLAP